MNPHANLPAGSETDPRAPWNPDRDPCRHCDEDLIRQEYRTLYPFVEEVDDDGEPVDTTCPEVEAFIEGFGLCRECNAEEAADWD
jgi:hypothetical protein